MQYLDMHKIIYSNHSTYNDEVDLLGLFLNDNLVDKVKPGKPLVIINGSEWIDEEYSKDYQIPIARPESS